jgi:RNA polymerase sigma-70 factor (ECF subfamily)
MSDETVLGDEAALVLAAQAGDAAAFESLVRGHLRHVRTFVALRAPVSHLVDEIAHDTFVFAHQRLTEFEPGTSLRAWLRPSLSTCCGPRCSAMRASRPAS